MAQLEQISGKSHGVVNPPLGALASGLLCHR